MNSRHIHTTLSWLASHGHPNLVEPTWYVEDRGSESDMEYHAVARCAANIREVVRLPLGRINDVFLCERCAAQLLAGSDPEESIRRVEALRNAEKWLDTVTDPDLYLPSRSYPLLVSAEIHAAYEKFATTLADEAGRELATAAVHVTEKYRRTLETHPVTGSLIERELNRIAAWWLLHETVLADIAELEVTEGYNELQHLYQSAHRPQHLNGTEGIEESLTDLWKTPRGQELSTSGIPVRELGARWATRFEKLADTSERGFYFASGLHHTENIPPRTPRRLMVRHGLRARDEFNGFGELPIALLRAMQRDSYAQDATVTPLNVEYRELPAEIHQTALALISDAGRQRENLYSDPNEAFTAATLLH